MAAVYIQIGTNSGTLTNLPKACTAPMTIGRQEQTKNKITFHGQRNVAILGQRKRVWAPTFIHVKSADYQTFAGYALSTRRWFVKIPGHNSGYNIYYGYAYVMFNNEQIEQVFDGTETYYKFELLIFEL
jgi:hypothetical protein